MAIFLVLLFLIAVAMGTYVVFEFAGAMRRRDATDEHPAVAGPF